MQPLPPDVMQKMRDQAKAVRERQQSGNFTKSWSLTGKNTVVEPGQSVIVRLCPRWDFANSIVVDPATGKPTQNPAYRTGFAYVVALEHWWDLEGGKLTREWCPRTIEPETPCAVCLSATALMASASKDDRDFGKRIQAREVFIFNAVVGNPRKVGQDGLADIRIMSCPGTIFNAVSDIMTGGDNTQFARGDIMSPRDGCDLAFKRPVGGGGDRWSVMPDPNSSPLYGPAQAAAFKGWATRLVDLEDMLQKETKDSAGIFKAFYGRDPERGEVAGAPPAADDQQAEPQAGAAASPFQAAPRAPVSDEGMGSGPESPDDEYMLPPPKSAAVAPQARSAVLPGQPAQSQPAAVRPAVTRPKVAPRAPRR